MVSIHVDPQRSTPLARVRYVPVKRRAEIQTLEEEVAELQASLDAMESNAVTSDSFALVDARHRRRVKKVFLEQMRSPLNDRYGYVLASKGRGPGMTLFHGPDAPFVPHARLPLSKIPMGTRVFDVEMTPGKGSQRVKTAGSSAERITKDEETKRILVRLPSKQERWVHESCVACIGQAAGEDHMLQVAGKAGITRRRGIRPTVRGVAMNPIDHPHGGRTPGGRHDVTPWAKIAKGKPTRSPRKTSVFVIKKPKSS